MCVCMRFMKKRQTLILKAWRSKIRKLWGHQRKIRTEDIFPESLDDMLVRTLIAPHSKPPPRGLRPSSTKNYCCAVSDTSKHVHDVPQAQNEEEKVGKINAIRNTQKQSETAELCWHLISVWNFAKIGVSLHVASWDARIIRIHGNVSELISYNLSLVP